MWSSKRYQGIEGVKQFWWTAYFDENTHKLQISNVAKLNPEWNPKIMTSFINRPWLRLSRFAASCSEAEDRDHPATGDSAEVRRNRSLSLMSGQGEACSGGEVDVWRWENQWWQRDVHYQHHECHQQKWQECHGLVNSLLQVNWILKQEYTMFKRNQIQDKSKL